MLFRFYKKIMMPKTTMPLMVDWLWNPRSDSRIEFSLGLMKLMTTRIAPETV